MSSLRKKGVCSKSKQFTPLLSNESICFRGFLGRWRWERERSEREGVLSFRVDFFQTEWEIAVVFLVSPLIGKVQGRLNTN